MKTGVILTAGLIIALGAAGAWRLCAADPTLDEKREAILMRAKLSASQQALEGLMSADYDLLGRGAKQLRDIEAWHSTKKDAVYDHYSAEFRRLAEKLVHLAEDENLEGAVFTYQHLTSICISCHQYVRDVPRDARRIDAGAK